MSTLRQLCKWLILAVVPGFMVLGVILYKTVDQTIVPSWWQQMRVGVIAWASTLLALEINRRIDTKFGEAAAEKGVVTCPHCQAKVKDAVLCSECYHDLKQICPSCGESMVFGQELCMTCAQRIAKEKPSGPGGSSN